MLVSHAPTTPHPYEATPLYVRSLRLIPVSRPAASQRAHLERAAYHAKDMRELWPYQDQVTKDDEDDKQHNETVFQHPLAACPCGPGSTNSASSTTKT